MDKYYEKFMRMRHSDGCYYFGVTYQASQMTDFDDEEDDCTDGGSTMTVWDSCEKLSLADDLDQFLKDQENILQEDLYLSDYDSTEEEDMVNYENYKNNIYNMCDKSEDYGYHFDELIQPKKMEEDEESPAKKCKRENNNIPNYDAIENKENFHNNDFSVIMKDAVARTEIEQY